ncbi:hypothetical protein CW713_08765 [Methanophagales archaeon]|nr:MAG: hypothetical protein CW713_08765 [Methanophagales archaeon]
MFPLYLLSNLLHLSYESQYGIVLPSELLRYLQGTLILHLLHDVEHLLDREFVVFKYRLREVIEISAAKATPSIGEKHLFDYT